LPLDDARALLELRTGGSVDKIRHYVSHEGHLWEVDEFLGDNSGLIVAEVELQSEDEPFLRPAWLGMEVTEQPRYYNLALTEHPYKRWTELEKS
jgi:adenylate cyclase